MNRNALVRLRWRLTGAWQWPTFVVLTVVDGLVIHWLPPEGDSEPLVGGWLIAMILTLLAMVLIGPLLGILIRRRRRGMPRIVARNYGGAFASVLVGLALLAGGIAHHTTVESDGKAVYDATQRAEAWIGDHAPPRFLVDLTHIDTIQIQPPLIYRSCVQDAEGQENYCVVVDRSAPWGTGVRYDGSESNELLNQGVS